MDKAKLPDYFKAYFWDVDFSTLNLVENQDFIIKRTLDRGDTSAIKWLLGNYPEEKIAKVVLTSKDLSPKTANFWADVFNLDHTKILCLQKPYSQTQFGLSS